jgi:hypothetical protein
VVNINYEIRALSGYKIMLPHFTYPYIPPPDDTFTSSLNYLFIEKLFTNYITKSYISHHTTLPPIYISHYIPPI